MTDLTLNLEILGYWKFSASSYSL